MKIVSSIWFISGIALMIWSVVALWRIGNNSYLGVYSGAFKATLISLGFSTLCIFGSAGLMFKKNWGRILILLASSIVLLYTAAYLLLGGFEDTGIIYAVIVAALVFLSISSLIIVSKKRTIKEWAT